MKIINIGILAHVDAGKTTLTESLLYASGAISEPGSVEKGTTRTDTMFLERQRGITIQAAVTSFQWHRCKVNIVDTPGHMDFLAEVYRSLAVLDGAILVISAKDGVQAQTRILFHALRKMNIPTVIFINKIDQAGVDLQSVVQSVRDKLSADIIIKQTVSLSPEIVLEENTDIEAWDAVIENNDELLEKYIAGEPISREKLAREEQQRVQDASLFPVYHGSAKNGLGIQPLMDAVTGLFQPIGEQGGAALCGSVFKVEYTDCGQRRVYLRLYSGTLRLRDTVALAGREKLKITEMRIPSKAFQKGDYALVISDITLPDGTGLDFGRMVRAGGDTYLIYLTALDQEIDIVNGYDTGADDYITKPFSLMALVSKVNALMRRLSKVQAQIMSSGEITVHMKTMQVYKGDEPVTLSKKEFSLLLYLWENAGQIVSKESILEHVWDIDGQFVDDNTVTVNISRLKNKLGTEEIANVRGLGYIWTGKVNKN